MILLDYRDKRPIYEQMVEKLERLIVNGGLEPLTKMPSVRSLAMELSVNPNTVQRAYAQLEQDGYLYTVSGRGSFVTAEDEWRESKQGKVLQEWNDITEQAREAGIVQERLIQELRRIYRSDSHVTEGEIGMEKAAYEVYGMQSNADGKRGMKTASYEAVETEAIPCGTDGADKEGGR